MLTLEKACFAWRWSVLFSYLARGTTLRAICVLRRPASLEARAAVLRSGSERTRILREHGQGRGDRLRRFPSTTGLVLSLPAGCEAQPSRGRRSGRSGATMPRTVAPDAIPGRTPGTAKLLGDGFRGGRRLKRFLAIRRLASSAHNLASSVTGGYIVKRIFFASVQNPPTQHLTTLANTSLRPALCTNSAPRKPKKAKIRAAQKPEEEKARKQRKRES
jgi:hypothetical protein